MKLEAYKLFVFDGKYYILTAKNNKIFKIDEKLYKILQKSEGDYSISMEKDNPYFEMIKENLCEDKNLVIRDNMDVQSMVLMIVQDCNLNCKYCYGDGGEFKNRGKMSIETARKAIDYLIENCGNRKKVSVAFFGGEPLLNFELIKATIEYIKKVSIEKNIKISKSITTNATLLTSEVRKYLIDNSVNIKVSIDGPEEVHDNVRVFSNGEGSYDDVMRNTEELRKMGKAVARATITPYCLYSKDIESFLYSVGFMDVGIAYAEELLDQGDYLKIIEIENSYFDEVKHLISDKKYEEIKRKYSKVLAYLSHIHSSILGSYPCGAGRTFFAVDKDGDLYPCQRFVGIYDFKLGSVFDGKDMDKHNEFLKKMNVKSHKKCDKCWCKNLCMGKCSYDNYIKTTKIEEVYDPACNLTLKLYERAVEIYVSLNEEDKKHLFLTSDSIKIYEKSVIEK